MNVKGHRELDRIGPDLGSNERRHLGGPSGQCFAVLPRQIEETLAKCARVDQSAGFYLEFEPAELGEVVFLESLGFDETTKPVCMRVSMILISAGLMHLARPRGMAFTALAPWRTHEIRVN